MMDMTTSWLVIPKNREGTLQPNLMQLVPAATADEAAARVYMNAVVLGPVADFIPGAMGHDDGPVATLPAEGQPQ